MKRCPYCFEAVNRKTMICPVCSQFVIDELLEVDYEAVDKKKCLFCGKNILTEAVVCRWCHHWIDEAGKSETGAEEENI